MKAVCLWDKLCSRRIWWWLRRMHCRRWQANVNCRILPGYSQEDIRQKLIALFAAPESKIEYITYSGSAMSMGSQRKSAPPPVREDICDPLRQVVAEMWPVVPSVSVGASDSIYTTAAGIPSYEVNGGTSHAQLQ